MNIKKREMVIKRIDLYQKENERNNIDINY